jgi:hypothetical protein
MNNVFAGVILTLVLLSSIMIIKRQDFEGFDAAGLVFNKPSEWFNKAKYNKNDWFVTYYPDQTSQPGGCDMHYRGNPEMLNWESSAYRFWRM